MNSIGFYAHKFVIIDLVSDNEMQTGRHIEETLLDAINAEASEILCERHKCTLSVDFFEVIEKVKSDVNDKGLISYIHIEGHGSKESLHFPDESSIKWFDVFEEFRKINILSKNNLFFSSGACESAHAFKSAKITEPVPVFGMLAPEDKVSAGEAVDGFIAFYKLLIKSESLNEAFRAFADATDGKKYALIFSQFLFERAAYKYLTQHCMGRGRQARLENSLSQAVSQAALPVNKARKRIRRELAKPQALALTRLHKKFMMCDMYPENTSRFPFDAVKFERDAKKGKLKIA